MKKLVTYIFALLLTSAISAQSLEITQPLQMIENSLVLAQYQNLFGKYEMPEIDESFPYSLISMRLEGSASEVKAAKEVLRLYLGTQKMVTDQYKENPNEILFLIENTVRNVYVTCGDGCERQLLVSEARFRPNKVYSCKVKYTPEEIIVQNTQPQIHNQYLQFKVEPKDATIEVDGQVWKVEDGSARKFVEFGTYKYVAKAADYKTQEGTVVVNDPENKQVITINLEPNYAKLTFRVDNNAEIWIDEVKKGKGQWQGALGFGQHQIITKLKGHRDNKIVQTITPQDVGKTIQLNAPTPIYGALNVDVMPDDAIVKVDGIQMGTTPCFLRNILIGSHQVNLSAEGYKDYSTTVIVSENQVQTLTAKLEEVEDVIIVNVEKPEEVGEPIFVIVDKMPEFPGGQQALSKYLSENIKYPLFAQENGIQGRVICQFIVNTDGSIDDVMVVRSVDPSLDKEAIRVLEAMPKWNPGKLHGEFVRVRYTMPVNFRL